MSNINHKNVYDLRDYEHAIFIAEAKVRDAQDNANRTRKAYQSACAKVAGCKAEELEFSNVGCMAKGICRHVYHLKQPYAQHGHPENKCIFCGCDNFDCGF